jgi:hypothetical protein
MTDELERRYARLLRMYPADYQRVRGAEVLETLLQSAGAGQVRPKPREVAALALGALRAQAGQTFRRSTEQAWLSALRTAGLMLLVYSTAQTAVRAVTSVLNTDGFFAFGFLSLIDPSSMDFAALALGFFAIVAVLRGRYRRAVIVAAVAFVMVQAVHLPSRGLSSGEFWQVPTAVALLLPLTRRQPTESLGSLTYLLGVPIIFVALEVYGTQVGPQAFAVQMTVLAALGVAGIVWAAVDTRVALALGLLLINNALTQAAFAFQALYNPQDIAISIAGGVVAPAVLLAIAASATRRQAQL